MKDRYDVIVVGAGPGGSLTARTASLKGLDVLLIEKRQQIGDPVRCAEGVNKEYLKEYIEPDPAWISAEVKGSKIYSPDGTLVEMSEELSGAEVGYVLERKVFDRALAREAALAGAEVMVKTRATGLLMEGGFVKGIKAEHMGKKYTIKADIVIGADGVESRVGRWAGIDTTLKPKDMCTCAQYLITDFTIDPDFCEFFLGNKIAPVGYIWVFPKGNNMANVGIGITGHMSGKGKPLELLDEFIVKRFPDCRKIELVVGGVPVSGTIDRTVANGLMLVGDAARQSDPVTGGGIFNAMWAGDIAGKVAANAIRRSDVSAESLQEYEQAWRAELGRDLNMSLVVKERFTRMTDYELNTLAHSLKGVDLGSTTLIGLVWALFKANKKLLWDLRSIFIGIKDIENEVKREVYS
ncbi:MAG: NAD(P)/FAD-dependent oxidoreductase [Methanosarcinales archaeon]|nr:NAD(P)/FAD-dependent oxidoreductase [Methanosarcinales archaeon]